MYERSLILKLNNYGYNDKQIEEVEDFLKDRNQIPEHLDTNAKMQRFYDKWSQSGLESKRRTLVDVIYGRQRFKMEGMYDELIVEKNAVAVEDTLGFFSTKEPP